MIPFLIACCVVFLILSILWNSNDLPNLLFKVVLIIMLVCSAFFLLRDLGFILAAPAGMRWF